MAGSPNVIHTIAWREVFPWLHLTTALRQSLRTRFLLLSALAVLVTIGGWWLIGKLFSGSEDPTLRAWIAAYASCPWEDGDQVGNGYVMPIYLSETFFIPPDMGKASGNPYLAGWANLSAPVRQLFDMRVTYVGLAFLLLEALWVILVWSLFGLAMTRMAVVQLCREENVSWGAAFRYARGKFIAAFASPVLPLLGILLVAIPIMIMGLFLRGDAAAYVAAILWPLAMVAGVVLAIIAIGLFFGWPLMSPAIAAEGSDSFDALSRAYSYVYQRPLHYLWYMFLAVVLGMIAAFFVRFFAGAVYYLTDWAASWGSGINRTPGTLVLQRHAPDAAKAGHILWFWSGFIRLLVVAFVYSYFWSAATQIYLLLRYDTDGTEMDEVFLEDDEPRGLPPLATDAAGVPVVADEGSETIIDEGGDLSGEPAQ